MTRHVFRWRACFRPTSAPHGRACAHSAGTHALMSPLVRGSQTDSELKVVVALTGSLAGLKRADVKCKVFPNKMRLVLDSGALPRVASRRR